MLERVDFSFVPNHNFQTVELTTISTWALGIIKDENFNLVRVLLFLGSCVLNSPRGNEALSRTKEGALVGTTVFHNNFTSNEVMSVQENYDGGILCELIPIAK